MKMKLVASVITAVIATALPATAETPKTTAASSAVKPNIYCYIPFVRKTSACTTYNSNTVNKLAPQPVQPARR